MIADIMKAEFGDNLVNAPIEGRKEIQVLPSPEDLKGRILLKVRLQTAPRWDLGAQYHFLSG